MRLNPGGLSEQDVYCTGFVAGRDRDRYLAIQYAPAAIRPALTAVCAFDIELMTVARTTTEPMVGEIRLAWWRERLQALGSGAPEPGQPVLRALAAHVVPRRLAAVSLEPLEDAALALMDDDVARHVALRGDSLFDALACLIMVRPDTGLREAACRAGRLWVATDLWRSGRPDARPLAEALARETPTRAPKGPARPLFALAALARADLAGRGAPVRPDGSAAPPGRQLRLLWSIVRGLG